MRILFRQKILCFILINIISLACLVSSKHNTEGWGTPKIISSMMIGVHLDEEVHAARIRYGSKSQELLFLLDFTERVLTISHVPTSLSGASQTGSHPSLWSSTYSNIDGGSDIIQIGSTHHRIPVRYDPTASAMKGCAICNGVLGVGAGSPIWLLWPRVTFTAGTTVLGSTRPPMADPDLPRIACDLADNILCTSTAEVYGVNYTIQFSFLSAYTYVPITVFNTYVGTRNVGDTNIRDWPHLILRFFSADAPGDTRRPTLKIAPESLLGIGHINEGNSLLLRIHPNIMINNDTIMLGRSVWRSLMMRRLFDSGRAVIKTYDSVKRFAFWVMTVALIVVLVACRWWKTQDALFYETPGFFQGQQQQPEEESTTTSGSRYKNIGVLVLDNNPMARAKSAVNTQVNYPAEWGVYPDRMAIEILSIPLAVASLYVTPLRQAVSVQLGFYIMLNIIVYFSVIWIVVEWIMRGTGGAGLMGVMEIHQSQTSDSSQDNAYFRVYRIGLIRQASVSFLLMVVMIMLGAYTRADTMGTFVIALSGLVLMLMIYYHAATAVLHMIRFHYKVSVTKVPTLKNMYQAAKRGVPLASLVSKREVYTARHNNMRKNPSLWFLWVLYMVLMALAVSGVFSIYVFFPALQTRVSLTLTGMYLTWIGVMNLGGAIGMYFFASYQIDSMADHITQHKELLDALIKKHSL